MKIVPANGRLIVFGDIHGNLLPIKSILKTIVPTKDDTFVFLGDYINRGLNSKEVIDEILNLKKMSNTYCILGNHEEMILAAFEGGKSEHNYLCKFGGEETLKSFNAKTVKNIPISYMKFFADCADYLETDDFIFVHAGCDVKENDLSKNKGSILRWGKINDSMHISNRLTICGHKPQKSIKINNGVLCIDSGCGLPKGKLTAIDLKSGTYWQADHKGNVKTKSL